MKRIIFIAGIILAGLLPLACQKTYTVSPLSAPTGTPTPNPLVCTPIPTPGVPPPGIYWYSAQVEGIAVNNGATIVNGIFAQVLLSVNGAAETSDTVNVAGPSGLSASLTYTSNVVQNGNSYAQYQALLTNSYQPGGNYFLTTVTSIGTASATLVGPGNVSVSSNGSSASWTNPGALNQVLVIQNPLYPPFSGPATLYQTAACSSENLSVNIPPSDYSTTGLYTITVDCQNMTKGITGGNGYFRVYQNYMMMLAVNYLATPTPQVCGDGGPTCTPTPFGAPLVNTLNVSSTYFYPSSGPATVSFTFPYLSGYIWFTIYSTSGLLTKYLESQTFSGTCTGCLLDAWDGTDDFNNPAPDGVYVFSLQEPTNWLLTPILLIR